MDTRSQVPEMRVSSGPANDRWQGAQPGNTLPTASIFFLADE
ncbi:hypothetical protein [Adhaeribacter rhizoryzae]|nr:hypothetical protein [Adhaeribacter rhizoryzae]